MMVNGTTVSNGLLSESEKLRPHIGVPIEVERFHLQAPVETQGNVIRCKSSEKLHYGFQSTPGHSC